MKKYVYTMLITFTLIISASVFLYLESEKQGVYEKESLVGEPYREIDEAAAFVNTDNKAITLGEYIGKKVILLEFMTYSCVNCQRSFPHMNAWYEKYRDAGLVIIGIHTPEYAFERELDNVTAALEKSGIRFPVVLDNSYATWSAYGNHYWPRTFIIGLDGTVVYDHIGAGAYSETESHIRKELEPIAH
jgi:thiol-disulfide isomerase/thioredoxin